MQMILWGAALIGSLIVLVRSADIFTKNGEVLGLNLGLSRFIIGVTIVSIGTSLPELATSVITVLSDSPEAWVFPIDNIIGSNIANCLLIAGVSAVAVKGLKVRSDLVAIDLPLLFMSGGLFVLFLLDRQFTVGEGIISLLLLVIFMLYTAHSKQDKEPKEENIPPLQFKHYAFLTGSMVALYFSAKYTVASVLELSSLFGITSTLLTMIVVAVGTSLPELIVSVQAAKEGKHSIALGNVFGSNVFNVLAVTGIPALFGTLQVSDQAWKLGIPFFIVSTMAFMFTTTDDEVHAWEGLGLLVIYVAFVAKLVGIL